MEIKVLNVKIFSIKQNKIFCLVGFIGYATLIVACTPQNNGILVEQPPFRTADYFYNSSGFEYKYDLYMPSSFGGWEHTEQSKFRYDERNQTYYIKNIPLNMTQVDAVGRRFKITSTNWQNQFGFSDYVPRTESMFGVSEEHSPVLQLNHFYNSNDIYIEVPPQSDKSYLSVFVKIISNNLRPEGLMFVKLTSTPI